MFLRSDVRRVVLSAIGMAAIVLLAYPSAAVAGFIIAPTFDTSITSSGNAAAIEGAINTAIGNIEALYGNNVTIPVTFTYDPADPGNLLSTSQDIYGVAYSSYIAALESDYIAHPTNTVLGTAIANLGSGNDANGADAMALTAGQIDMLGISNETNSPGNVTININSTQGYSFSEPTSSGQFDLIGGLEHELDETMGGGGGGSMLNAVQQGACTPNSDLAFFCDKYGSLDLLRYSALNTPSFTTSGTATAYLSINGGATQVVAFNQNSGGDYGDFAPPGNGAGQLIQNAFNGTGQDEAYTTSSPEFIMQEAIGWDASTAAPEPGTIVLISAGLALIGIARRRLA